MIPGHPPKTTYRTIAQKDWGVPMCASADGCPKAMGWRAHWYGRPDRHGMIHWKQADARATRRGMRQFLKMMALNTHREWWTEPVWMRLYLTNVWAYRTLYSKYHYRMRVSWSISDRKEALRLARRSPKIHDLRHQYRNFYVWTVTSINREVQSSSQKGVQTKA